MTEQELVAKALDISLSGFLSFSFVILSLTFLIKITIEDSNFEYLKQIFWVSITAITFFISFETFRVEKLDGFRKDKIAVETSNLSSQQKESYLKSINQDIHNLNKMEINYVFFLAGIILIGILFIALRDYIPKWIRHFNKKSVLKHEISTIDYPIEEELESIKKLGL